MWTVSEGLEIASDAMIIEKGGGQGDVTDQSDHHNDNNDVNREVREKVNTKLQHNVSQTTVWIPENFVKCLLGERWVERFQGLVNK